MTGSTVAPASTSSASTPGAAAVTSASARLMMSRALASMQPRDREHAARMVFTLAAVASVVTMVSALLDPRSGGGRVMSLIVTAPLLGVFLAAVWALRYGQQPRALAWAVVPYAALGLIVALDLLSRDATVAAQVFLFFPALYAGSQLQRPAALAICLAATISDAVITFLLLPAATAIVDLTYVTAVITTTSAVIIHAVQRGEVLTGQLQRQAATDPLTGLVTRRVLDSAARTALSGAASDSGTALIILDVDRFKAVNDLHGHPAGDQVLMQVAGILLNLSRPEDTVTRMGGDEMALLLPGCAENTAIERAEHIRATVAAHHFTINPSIDVQVSLSVGVAHAPTNAVDLRTLYTAADAALYQAKRHGRNRIACHLRRGTAEMLAFAVKHAGTADIELLRDPHSLTDRFDREPTPSISRERAPHERTTNVTQTASRDDSGRSASPSDPKAVRG